jgi:hypothetical protein
MRSLRSSLLLCLLLFNVSVWGQETQPGTAPPPAPKDPQALSVLTQALAVAGGATAINAIADYRATGDITYSGNPQVQGSVTVQGLGLNECRLDADLPNGVRSWAVTEGRLSQKDENSFVQLIHSQIAMHLGGLVFPYQELSFAVNSWGYGITNKGLTQVNGHSAYDIQVQLVGAGMSRPQRLADFYTRDYFVDATSFQIVMTQDFVPVQLPRQLQYSNFTLVNGVLVPLSITEVVYGHQTWTIQLNQISFNTGLQDSAFVLQ